MISSHEIIEIVSIDLQILATVSRRETKSPQSLARHVWREVAIAEERGG